VKDGVSGFVCYSAEQMAQRAKNLRIAPAATRKYVEENFSLDVMVGKYLDLYNEIYNACRGVRVEARAEKNRAIA
jgi:glycosyltransferase involved in cell wall biosynthesis